MQKKEYKRLTCWYQNKWIWTTTKWTIRLQLKIRVSGKCNWLGQIWLTNEEDQKKSRDRSTNFKALKSYFTIPQSKDMSISLTRIQPLNQSSLYKMKEWLLNLIRTLQKCGQKKTSNKHQNKMDIYNRHQTLAMITKNT